MGYTDDLPHQTLRQFWEDRVEMTPEREFVTCEGRTWTYGEFDRWVESLAVGLRARGVDEGTHVALLLPSGIDLLRLEWALAKLGAVWVPAIPGSTYDEAKYVIEHSRARFLVTDREHWDVLVGGGAPDDLPTTTFLADGEDDGAGALAAVEEEGATVPPLEWTDGESLSMILYTSGSTGRPKGVMIKSSAFPRLGHFMDERMQTGPEDRWYCNLPLFHGAAQMTVFPAIRSGAALFLRPRFSRSRFLDDVREHRLTAGFLMPGMVSMVLTQPRRDDDADNTLRVVYGHVRNEEFSARFGTEIVTVWCSTETMGAGAMAYPGYDPERGPDVIGPRLPEDAEIKVVAEDGHELGPEEPGEFVVRSPNSMLGYYRDEENTAKTLRDGWVYTGDLGTITPTGGVRYMGRIKNVIKRSGENVAGEEVEIVIAEHPAVEDCVVCAVPDPIRTEEVYATVSRREPVTEGELIAWCRERLSDFKVPRYLKLTDDELPRLPNDKLDRRRISGVADPESTWDRQAAEAVPSPLPAPGR